VSLAAAQLPLRTLAGRQIGDGRPATAASLNRPSGVAFAADGALIIGDRGHYRLRRVDPTTGIITTLAGSVAGGTGNGMIADQAEMRDPRRVHLEPTTGDLFVAEAEGQVVRRFINATGKLKLIAGLPTVAGSTGDGGGAAAALLNGPIQAVPDGVGGLLVADRLNHKIRRVDGFSDMSTVAGSGTPGYTGDNVPSGALLAQLNFAGCVLPIPGGGFFICDEGNHVIRRVDTSGTITTVAGNGLPGFADGPATLGAQLDAPVNLAFADATGTVLLVVDRNNHRIRRLDLTADTLTTIAGTGEDAFTPDGAPAAASAIFRPAAITVAPDGRIVFAEDGAHRVRAIDLAGNLVTLAGDGIDRFGGDGGPAVDAQFGQVKSVTRDRNGNFLVSDAGSNRVRRVDRVSGVVETVAGSGDPVFSGDGGPALAAGLTLSDVVEDASGNIIISDTDNHRIRRIDAAGVIATIVGTGVSGFAGDGGPATEAQIAHPTGLELDAAGNLYIADFDNSAVRRVAPNGIITTVAGTGGAPGFNGDDMLATAAMLANPTDMAVDAAGNLYIADFGNHRIRRVDAATGLIATVGGTGGVGNDGDGGPAVAARFTSPSDVKVDETGVLWVADSGNHRVRRFRVGGNVETVAGSGLRGYAGDGGDPLQARFLFPIRLFVLGSDQVLIADRDNFAVRLLGNAAFACTGDGASTCIPGGGKQAGTDCILEFKVLAPLPAGVPPPTLSCVDGDAACDADGVSNGQCTFRIRGCLNNEDTRLPCVPGAITAIKVRQSKGDGGQAFATSLGALAPSTLLSKGRGVAFRRTFTYRNACTPASDFVVVRKKKKGKGALSALASTASSGRDKDKLKLGCLAP
jgi:sugar lactone lactonase YvrE